MRRRVNPRKDKRIFSRTANRSKSVNLGAGFYRGGIRF